MNTRNECTTCKGSGTIYAHYSHPDQNGRYGAEFDCPDCDGRGYELSLIEKAMNDFHNARDKWQDNPTQENKNALDRAESVVKALNRIARKSLFEFRQQRADAWEIKMSFDKNRADTMYRRQGYVEYFYLGKKYSSHSETIFELV